jgi:hypothetical protein
MTEPVSLYRIDETVRFLALEENDFAAGDAVVESVARLKENILALDAHEEPWLIEWLSDEHYKGAVLYAAAKTNWKQEQAARGSFADRQMRVRIVERFSQWVQQLTARLREYESGPHAAATVAPWRIELAQFREDPVRNA